MTLLISSGRKVERFQIFSPFGIRFWDPAMNQQVTDGLTVIAYPAYKSYQSTVAIRTVSGIYAFHNLPGLRSVEYPLVSDQLFSPNPKTAFIIQVTDNQQRFLPVRFSVDLPVNGIYPTDALNGANAVKPPGFYLFSASTRATGVNMAVLRVDLVERIDAVRTVPAAFAVLEITGPDNVIQYGLADEQGSLTILFPYPPFAIAMGSSPPQIDIHQKWILNVKVRYQPGVLGFVKESRLPDLSSVFKQSQGAIWSDPNQAAQQITVELFYREELVLHSVNRSSLLISPALTSP